jgi:uncharacterized glyoxalase superfamily protein PhnB
VLTLNAEGPHMAAKGKIAQYKDVLEFTSEDHRVQTSYVLGAEQLFAALADGGQVQMPMAKTFFASRFGMVADRFGVSWMLYVAP